MKKIILSIAVLAFIFGATLTSCTKEDTTKPVITLVDGDVTISIGGTYTEPGYSAEDDTDGDLTSSVLIDNGGFDAGVKGVYTFTYTVTDAAGNVGEATRTVTVKNDKENMAGNYTVSGTYNGSADTYYTTEVVTASSTVNNRIVVARLAAFNSAAVYMNVSGSTITIPSQTYNCGTDHLDRVFVGSGVVNTTSSFSITGTVALASTPTVTIPWSYVFTF